LTGNHSAPSKEKFVKTIGKLSEFLFNFFLVFDYVVIPHFDGVSVMNTLVSYSLDFKATSFNLVHIPEKRTRSIGARENIFTHENSP
jgi:hypothetical protein